MYFDIIYDYDMINRKSRYLDYGFGNL